MKISSNASRRVTMRDIALELGLSHVTVSLALGDSPRLPESRRAQVKETARRMGYRPDPMLAALLHYRNAGKKAPIRSAIAWINTWTEPAELRKYKEFDGYWTGAREVAEAHGYHLEEFTAHNEVSFNRLKMVLAARNIQGLLLPPSQTAGMLMPSTLPWDNYAIVCFGHSHTELPAHVVTANQTAAGRLAFAKATELGYKRVGFVTIDGTLKRMLFSAGYLQGQSLLPPSARIPLLALSECHTERHKDDLRTWITDNRPDAIITDHSGLSRLLKTISICVPRDVGLAALSILDGNADAGINQNPVEIGRGAAETLVSLINHNHRGIPKFQRHILVEGVWTNGSTMPPRM
jgi:LacI family transcriptional regulator